MGDGIDSQIIHARSLYYDNIDSLLMAYLLYKNYASKSDLSARLEITHGIAQFLMVKGPTYHLRFGYTSADWYGY